ncbi:iron-hydroxamate ABC transporter substrate-binding protein [Listeria sp. PSOL-1]|uniref:iron-hydroxamate ABC transporter substrate-binding protein n=1 Tax=Listeria sp. PSOL-1 TaxID=1844999 RepID=UPI0013D5CDF9|nr:iron-hydroxamate ABC transporter substrate-binding protein [Listeria sp. PSOL-1]
MKKIGLFVALLMISLVLVACGEDNKTSEKENKTITFKAESGDIQVPRAPKRVVVLSAYAGDLIKLGIHIVGVDSFSKDNPNFKKSLKDAKTVSDEDIEDIIALKPDLIIGLSTIKNQDKLKKIAPVVTFTYGKLDYLNQHIAIGKVVNKENEAKKWAADFKKRAEKTGEQIKAKIGADKTISVAEKFSKEIYVFGDNWGRGTEILYQTMKLKMPDNVKKKALKPGYYAVSPEELPNYTGDYLILNKNSAVDNSFMKTTVYQNMPAVKNHHVLEVNTKSFYFNDATTLEYQLKTFQKFFLLK